MANLIKKIKIKQSDGSFSDYIPIGVDSSNVILANNKNLETELNNLDENKLEASNIVAGDNISIQTSGNDIVISSTGGGGGTIPTKTSDLTNDSGYLTSETDPVFNASVAKNITSTDITNWNNKQAALVSGTNIKTINNESILGNGNISLPQVTDSYSVSTTDSYSCNYVNGLTGKILYENPSGTSSSFSLSEYWKNFKEIEVYFLAADWLCNSSKMDCNSQASLVLATPYGDQPTSIAIASVIIQFSGTTVSFAEPRTMTFDSSYDAPTITESADIKVTKVIGYR